MSNVTNCCEQENCKKEGCCTTIVKNYYGCGSFGHGIEDGSDENFKTAGITVNGIEVTNIVDSDTIFAEVDELTKTAKFVTSCICEASPRIDLTVQTVDDFNENGNESISIQADGGTVQHARTDPDGVFTNKFVKTDTPYTFSVTEPPEALAGKIISKPRKSATTGTLDLPMDVTLEYVRTDLADPQYADLMNDIISENAGKEYGLGISTFGAVGSTANKWRGGVLAPNGKIYGIPLNSASVLEFDPETRTVGLISGAGSGTSKWTGGVLAPNGKIYGIPYDSASVLEIDPETRKVDFISGAGSGTIKWAGGVLAPNGKIYGIPNSSAFVLEIDPETRTVDFISGAGSGTSKWRGGVLAPNGKIYGIPYDSASVLEIDPETRTVGLISGAGSGTIKWTGGVLAPNGKIYGIPYDSASVLEIDPETRTVGLISGAGSGTNKWRGGVLAPNGKIYGIPCNSASVLEIDPETRALDFISGAGSGTNKWYGGVLAPNGKIYGIPYDSASVSVLEISLSGLTNFGPTALRSAYINKL